MLLLRAGLTASAGLSCIRYSCWKASVFLKAKMSRVINSEQFM